MAEPISKDNNSEVQPKKSTRNKPLTEDEITAICELVESGENDVSVARKVGVGCSSVAKVRAERHIARKIEDAPGEIWRPAVGMELDYLVSNKGRVIRISPKRGTFVNRPLKNHIDNSGYPYVFLSPSKSIRGKSYRLHILVAAAFIGPRPPDLQTNHKNGNKLDARPENLEYVTISRNMQHAYQMGLIRIPKYRGEPKLSKDKVAQIAQMLDDGYSLMDIAARYDVTSRAISFHKRKLAWQRSGDMVMPPAATYPR